MGQQVVVSLDAQEVVQQAAVTQVKLSSRQTS
jgi:hypothetical protein